MSSGLLTVEWGELSMEGRRRFSSQFPSRQAVGLETAGALVPAGVLETTGVLGTTGRLESVTIGADCGTGYAAQLLLELLGPLAVFPPLFHLREGNR